MGHVRPSHASIALSVALSLGAAAPVRAADLVDRIVAVVNDDAILLSELDEISRSVEERELRGLGGEAREEAQAELRAALLDGLIADKLLEQAMERADIEVGEREVEAAIADVARQNGLTVERLFAELERQGISADEYRRELGDQIRKYQFMNLQIRGRVNVTEEDIRAAWLQAGAATAPEPAWTLQRILLAFPAGADEEQRAAILAEADALEPQLREGKDWAEVARARSDDVATKERGGEAGTVRRRDLGEAFASALGAAGVGEVVRVDLPTGVWLLRIADEVDAAKKEFEEVREQIARRLYDEAMAREMEKWTEEERRRAHVEILL